MAIVLCCGESGCARVDFADDGVEISDSENTVKLTQGEWDLLVEKIKKDELE